MAELPSGTVTFLFTDIEGSTKRWEQQPELMRGALARHDRLLREAIEAHGGAVFKTVGDAFCAAFGTAPEALNAALAAQRMLAAEPWGAAIGPLKVRMALHTGAAELRDGDYFGPPLNRVARLLAAGHGEQILLSQAAYELVKDGLSPGVGLRDLGEHRLKDLQWPERILQAVTAGLPADFPPLRTLDGRPNNLPVTRSPLIGREKELAAAQQLLLRGDAGLLTLSGPGGTGKTRLSLQLAAELADRFPDGVFFVPLAAVEDPGLVAAGIAQAVGVVELAGQPVRARLLDYLRDKRLLLVLDNFEQVVDAAPLVAEMLAAAAGLKVIVTSREVLHLRGEQEFRVPPLGLPDPANLPGAEALSQYEAVALFIERARLVNPSFAVTNENAPAVAEICYRLDGLPLAIELAAARIRLLTPQAMLARLSSRLSFLTGGARDLPVRHQTLRSTIQWSYDLLSPPEQMLFRRVAVFEGGGSLEAIELVCNADGALGIDVLDGLASLLDKSLIRQESRGEEEPRFAMLETIREYALELLRRADQDGAELAAIREQHARYYQALAEQTEDKVNGRGQVLWLGRLEREHANLRATLDWALATGNAETALNLCVGMLWFWMTRGYVSEGSMWIESALALPAAEQHSAARASALMVMSTLSWRQNEFDVAVEAARQSVAMWQERVRRGEHPGSGLQSHAYALVALGAATAVAGDPQAARRPMEEALRMAREAGDKPALANALIDMGLLRSSVEERAEARAAFEESLALFRALGNDWGVAQCVNSLGDLARLDGDYARAGRLYQESLTLYRALENRADVPASLHNLGYVAIAQGRIEEAAALFREALEMQVRQKNKAGIAECLAGLAAVAEAGGQPDKAARLFGTVHALQGGSSLSMWPAEQLERERYLAAARARLDDQAWHKAWAEGSGMSMEQAIEAARRETGDGRREAGDGVEVEEGRGG